MGRQLDNHRASLYFHPTAVQTYYGLPGPRREARRRGCDRACVSSFALDGAPGHRWFSRCGGRTGALAGAPAGPPGFTGAARPAALSA
ncbi:hypothetical protein EAO76_26745 [Streptomyces sp. sk2.1]|nr:hypothetical protein EAO76_26745 [Streptomyces sp. sk2.1]